MSDTALEIKTPDPVFSANVPMQDCSVLMCLCPYSMGGRILSLNIMFAFS